ncbi:MAG: tonB-system energizer ExbB [Hyphomicrobium sp.]|uniref:tonB-system energizer ExbB n=1 Tax=Hyphomicrobium sp. TaxID=82 RepID=UPI003D1333B4
MTSRIRDLAQLAAVCAVLGASLPISAQETAPPAVPAPAAAEPSAPAATSPAPVPQAEAPTAVTPASPDAGASDAAPEAAPAADAPAGPAPAPDALAPPAPDFAPAGPAAGTLPRDLSPWNMFLSADLVVKAVMIGLAFASLVTWTVWLAKSIELTWARRRLTRGYKAMAAAASLAQADAMVGEKRGLVAGLIRQAAQELEVSRGITSASGIKERVASRLDGLVLAAGREMTRGTGVLATIGSTAPFVGLFGTVWGIMNSFIGISEAQTTNLAVVAPGIAEALLATAIGLVAAIPAVIIYNQFARSIASYRALIAEASAEVQRFVSRDLDRAASAGAASTTPAAALARAAE